MPLAEQQHQQLAFDFDSDFDAADNEDELEGDDSFVDDPEFYNTGDFPSVRLTLDEVPFAQRRRVLRLRPGVIPTIACALSGIVRAPHQAISSVVRPPATASESAPEPAPEPAAQPAPSQPPEEDTALPEPAIVYDGADDTPNINLSQRDFLDYFSAIRHAFVGLPDRWRRFLELSHEFMMSGTDDDGEPASSPPDLQPQPQPAA